MVMEGLFLQKKELYKKIKRLRFYGIETVEKNNKFFNKYYANENGLNSRIDENSMFNFEYKIEFCKRIH